MRIKDREAPVYSTNLGRKQLPSATSVSAELSGPLLEVGGIQGCPPSSCRHTWAGGPVERTWDLELEDLSSSSVLPRTPTLHLFEPQVLHGEIRASTSPSYCKDQTR